ncbi:MAG: hypothetical protein QM803_02475 [Rhodocyclaceae bacterium]
MTLLVLDDEELSLDALEAPLLLVTLLLEAEGVLGGSSLLPSLPPHAESVSTAQASIASTRG